MCETLIPANSKTDRDDPRNLKRRRRVGRRRLVNDRRLLNRRNFLRLRWFLNCRQNLKHIIHLRYVKRFQKIYYSAYIKSLNAKMFKWRIIYKSYNIKSLNILNGNKWKKLHEYSFSRISKKISFRYVKNIKTH